jgi:hypothetical protein
MASARPYSLRRRYLNAGGYDNMGCYWGVGAPLYEMNGDNGHTAIFRALTRDAAEAQAAELANDPEFKA